MREKYLAYIDWETFEKIQACCATIVRSTSTSKAVASRVMGQPCFTASPIAANADTRWAVRYKSGSQYVCNYLKIQRGAPECQNLRAAPIDAQVAAAFLEAMAPAEIDALSKAQDPPAVRKSPTSR